MTENNSFLTIISPSSTQGKELSAKINNSLSVPITLLTSHSQARDWIQKRSLHIVLVDITCQTSSGLSLIEYLNRWQPHTVCLAVVPFEDRDLHIQALRCGAQTTISSPVHEEEAALTIQNIPSYRSTGASTQESNTHLRDSDGFYGIVGASPSMRKLFDLISRLGEEGESTVLIKGESGVGKELVAKALHKCSPRKKKNFVAVNCAAIPDSLLESELFGYEKGAFTGASQNKKGRLHQAQGGTLFLDEIGEMQPMLQSKLLRILQEKEFEPLGSVRPVPIDTRVIAATNIDLEQAVQQGSFRTDLYYRLSVVPVNIPPLRDRQADIPILLDKFALLHHRGKKGKPKTFSPEAIQILKDYHWPGNVRELKNLVQRLCILHTGSVINADDLPQDIRLNHEAGKDGQEMDEELTESTFEKQFLLQGREEDIDFNSQVSDFEDRLILQALISTNGNKKQAAEQLKLKRTTLMEKIKKKGLDHRLLQMLNDPNLNEPNS